VHAEHLSPCARPRRRLAPLGRHVLGSGSVRLRVLVLITVMFTPVDRIFTPAIGCVEVRSFEDPNRVRRADVEPSLPSPAAPARHPGQVVTAAVDGAEHSVRRGPCSRPPLQQPCRPLCRSSAPRSSTSLAAPDRDRVRDASERESIAEPNRTRRRGGRPSMGRSESRCPWNSSTGTLRFGCT